MTWRQSSRRWNKQMDLACFRPRVERNPAPGCDVHTRGEAGPAAFHPGQNSLPHACHTACALDPRFSFLAYGDRNRALAQKRPFVG